MLGSTETPMAPAKGEDCDAVCRRWRRQVAGVEDKHPLAAEYRPSLRPTVARIAIFANFILEAPRLVRELVQDEIVRCPMVNPCPDR